MKEEWYWQDEAAKGMKVFKTLLKISIFLKNVVLGEKYDL